MWHVQLRSRVCCLLVASLCTNMSSRAARRYCKQSMQGEPELSLHDVDDVEVIELHCAAPVCMVKPCQC